MVAENETATHIYASLTYAINDRIKFANSIVSNEARNFGEQHLRYKLKQRKKTGTFDILNNISDYVTLLKLMDSIGNESHTVSVGGKWIFD